MEDYMVFTLFKKKVATADSDKKSEQQIKERNVQIYLDIANIVEGITPKSAKRPSPEFKKLIENAQKSGYVLYDSSGTNPKVVVMGDYHEYRGAKNGKCYNTNELANLLRLSLEENDKILLEKVGGRVVLGLETLVSQPVHMITDVICSKRVTVALIDSKELCSRLIDVIHKMEANTSNGNRIEMDKEYLDLMDKRDSYFFNGPWGIKYWLEKKGRVYQVVGLRHVVAGNITEDLKKNNVDYAVFVPSKIKESESTFCF